MRRAATMPCRYCNTPFSPVHWREVYCTEACRYAAKQAGWRRSEQKARATRPPKPPAPVRTISIAEVLRQGRTGDSFTLISDNISRVARPAEVRQIWEANATEEDWRERSEAETYIAGQRRAALAGGRTMRVPVVEMFSGDAFGNNVRTVQHGTVRPGELGHSPTGCAAAWVAGAV